MKFIIILNIFIISCWSLQTDILENKKWIEFKQTYNKEYHSIKEELKRFNIFQDNLNRIKKHNKLYKTGMTTFKMGLNQFGDLTSAEFVKYATGFTNDTINKLSSDNQHESKNIIDISLRNSIDWRIYGLVTQVKNQFSCLSCYAFSAVGAIEGQLAKKTGRLVTLSEQNIIDCSTSYGNRGCFGGRANFAFEYVKNHGIQSSDIYPYIALPSNCQFNPISITSIINYLNLSPGDEESLQRVIHNVGPISVTIDVPHNMQFYKEGIYYNPECSSTDLKHSVLAVGYGQNENEQQYYIIKNSWGTNWGEQGYLKLLRNHNNHCGIATFAFYPIL